MDGQDVMTQRVRELLARKIAVAREVPAAADTDGVADRAQRTQAMRRRYQFVGLMSRLRAASARSGDEKLVAALTDCIERAGAGDPGCPVGRLLSAEAARAGVTLAASAGIAPQTGTPFASTLADPRAALPFVLRAATASAFAAQDEEYRAAVTACEATINSGHAHCPVARLLNEEFTPPAARSAPAMPPAAPTATATAPTP